MSGKINDDEDESSVMKPESRDRVDRLSVSTASLSGYAGGGNGGTVGVGLDSAWATEALLGSCGGCFNSLRIRT
jgi:hypothetical protein